MAPSLVQSVSATGGASSPLTATLGSPTTAGNCVIVTFTSSAATNPAVTGITLGGSADNFASVVSAGTPTGDFLITSIWADPGCAGGQTAVAVSFSPASTSVCITVMEWSGLLTSSVADKTASQINDSGTTSWSSTATATTSQASEVAIGCVGAFNGTAIGTITGPSSPWTNLTQETSASTHVGLLTGYQVLSSTGTPSYAGTTGVTAEYTAVIATFKASSGVTGTGSVSLAAMSVAGSGAEAIPSTGSVSLSGMDAAGTAGNTSLVTASGGASLAAMSVAGAGQVPVIATGSVSLSGMAAGGSGMVPVIGSGSVSLAAMSAGGHAGTGTVTVAGTWTGSYAVASGFLFPFPAARPVQVAVANTPGDWLFCLVAWRPSTTGADVSVCVADDAHNWWEPVGAPAADSGAAGAVRTALWAAPAARVANSVTGVTQVQVAATGPVLSLCAFIADVSGMLPWYQVAAIGANEANAATSLSLSASALNGAILFAGLAHDNSSVTVTGPGGGWASLGAVTASNGVDHTADLELAAAWITTVSALTVTGTGSATGPTDLAGVIAGVLVSAPAPLQPNPSWPVMITEAAIGSGVQTPPSELTWADISARSLALSMKQGKQYSQGSLSAGQGSITLDNPDGALIPPGTGAFTGIDSGTPLRRRLIWPSSPTPHYVPFSGYFRRWPWQMDAGLRGVTQAEIGDVWAYAAGPLNSMAVEECLIDDPYALWPGTDPAGSTSASNLSPGNSLPLTQVVSKYGAGGATADFGASAFTLTGASSAQVTTSGTGGGGTGQWLQALTGSSLAYNGYGYALACTDPGYPAISGGVTVETWASCSAGADLAALHGNVGFIATASASPAFAQQGTTYPDGMPLVLSVASGFTFPSPFTAGTVYYVTNSDGKGNYDLSATQGGAVIACTASGEGFSAPQLAWNPVILQLRDGKGTVAGLSVRNTDGALLLLSRNGASVTTTAVDTGSDYRAGFTHFSLAVTQTAWRLLVDGGGHAVTTGSGTFATALPATFRAFTAAGVQDAVQQGYALPGAIGFAGVYPGISPPIRVLSRWWSQIHGMTGEAACDRVERILEYAGLAGRRWLGQQNQVAYEGDLCASGQDIGGQPAASSAGNIAASTLPAQLYIAPTGDITYLSKLYTWNQPVRWTLGDNTAGGEIPFLPGAIATDYDPTRVSSPVQVTSLDTQYVTVPSGATSSTTMAAVTAASGRQYGGQPYQSTSYLLLDASSQYTAGGSSVDLANWVANIYRKPQNRIQAVTVDAARHPLAWPFWGGASVGDMVAVNVRPPTGAYTISLTARITQTDRASQFSQDGTSGTITCTLDFAPEFNALTCDDPVRGLLNGVNCLGW